MGAKVGLLQAFRSKFPSIHTHHGHHIMSLLKHLAYRPTVDLMWTNLNLIKQMRKGLNYKCIWEKKGECADIQYGNFKVPPIESWEYHMDSAFRKYNRQCGQVIILHSGFSTWDRISHSITVVHICTCVCVLTYSWSGILQACQSFYCGYSGRVCTHL